MVNFIYSQVVVHLVHYCEVGSAREMGDGEGLLVS